MSNKCSAIICVSAVLLMISVDAFSWGQKGHDVTCAVAQRHLSKKADKKIREILDGKSIVYWANWMDSASHTSEYSYTKTWHYKNLDAEDLYDSVALNPKGDVVTAIEAQLAALRCDTLTKDQQALALKMLVHFTGDIHCPMHLGHKIDSGGNKWQMKYFGKGTNLHSVWDSEMIERVRKWSYSEWAEQLDVLDKTQEKEIVAGTPYEWGRETWTITSTIYDSTPTGSSWMYNYNDKWSATIEQQLLVGGLRLASLLNSLFGN